MRVTALAVLLIAGVPVFVCAQEAGEEQAPVNITLGDTEVIDAVDYEGKRIRTSKDKIGPGMEIIQLDEVNIVAPKGTRVRKQGSQILFEDSGEYLGRKFDEIDKRFADVESRLQDLGNETRSLRKALTGMLTNSTMME